VNDDYEMENIHKYVGKPNEGKSGKKQLLGKRKKYSLF